MNLNAAFCSTENFADVSSSVLKRTLWEFSIGSNNHVVDADVSLFEDDQGRVEPSRNRVSTNDIDHVCSAFKNVELVISYVHDYALIRYNKVDLLLESEDAHEQHGNGIDDS